MRDLDIIFKYQESGYKIFPCKPNGKEPLTPNGFYDASSDKDKVKSWWSLNQDANIGLTTGKTNNLVVVDIDVKSGNNGFDSINLLQQENEDFTTKTIRTPSGGVHYLFEYPEGVDNIKCKANLLPGVDIRADGGYVIAPGSEIDGNSYYVEDESVEISELPEWLLGIINGDEGGKRNEMQIDAVQEGSRNNHIFKMASKFVGDGVPFELAKTQVLLEAQMCEPPLPESEAIKCLESAYSRYQPNPENPTDAGNAKRLIRLFGIKIKYIAEFKKWIYWNGSRWVFDDSGYMMRCAKETAMSIIDEARRESDDSRRTALMRHAISSENKQRLEAMVDVAKSEEGVTISQSQLDQDKYLIGVSNGVVDLKTGSLLDGAKDRMITKQAHVEFRPDSACPRWIQFIDEITDNDQELAKYLQKIVGYSLTGDTKEQILFFLYGHGANGKSVFVNTIQRLMGDYAMQTPVSTIMTKGKGSINNDVARLRGARFVATTETEEGSRFNESEVKLLTGGDMITARFLHQEYFEFRPQFKIWISGNHKPVPGDGYGIWRRLILVPFNVRFSGEQKDQHLEATLTSELSGILNWAIEGCVKWQEEGLEIPKVIDDATKEYKSEMDRVNSWMDECCDDNATINDLEKSSDLYKSYREWARDNGEWEMNQRILGTKLTERGLIKKRTSKGWMYSGIKLNNSVDF